MTHVRDLIERTGIHPERAANRAGHGARYSSRAQARRYGRSGSSTSMSFRTFSKIGIAFASATSTLNTPVGAGFALSPAFSAAPSVSMLSATQSSDVASQTFWVPKIRSNCGSFALISTLCRLNFPTFSWGSYGQDAGPRYKVVDFRIPVEIGGVLVSPGDMLFGDIDGVCCIPRDMETEVFTKALEKARAENKPIVVHPLQELHAVSAGAR